MNGAVVAVIFAVPTLVGVVVYAVHHARRGRVGVVMFEPTAEDTRFDGDFAWEDDDPFVRQRSDQDS